MLTRPEYLVSYFLLPYIGVSCFLYNFEFCFCNNVLLDLNIFMVTRMLVLGILACSSLILYVLCVFTDEVLFRESHLVQ